MDRPWYDYRMDKTNAEFQAAMTDIALVLIDGAQRNIDDDTADELRADLETAIEHLSDEERISLGHGARTALHRLLNDR